MRGRRPRPLVLRHDHVPVLQALVRSGKTEQRVATRAQILLTMAAGERTGHLAAHVEQDEATIWRVCRRYEQRGLQAVSDAPRSGRPRAISPPGAGPD
jgi:transposase